jgi:hypothetical protein
MSWVQQFLLAEQIGTSEASTSSRNPYRYIKAGLRLANIAGDLAKGALSECHTGTPYLDEAEQLKVEEIGALFGAMQHGWFSEEKASVKVSYIPARVGVVFLANNFRK